MTSHPVYQMRGFIVDAETYGLAEQAGMFCEALSEILGADLSLFDGFEFGCHMDEPYEMVFMWDRGSLRVKLSFLGDPDDSTWFVGDDRRRFRGAIGTDRCASCRRMLDSMRSIRE